MCKKVFENVFLDFYFRSSLNIYIIPSRLMNSEIGKIGGFSSFIRIIIMTKVLWMFLKISV